MEKKSKCPWNIIHIILEPISERLSFFLQTSPDKILLNKPIIFYDIEITFWWFYDTNMFIRCIISLQKIGRSLTEVNCVKIRSFRENFNHDRTTFLLIESHFWQFLPHWSEIEARIELLTFSMCIGEY